MKPALKDWEREIHFKPYLVLEGILMLMKNVKFELS